MGQPICTTGTQITRGGDTITLTPLHWLHTHHPYAEHCATLCMDCPLLRHCAHKAMTAGNTIDGHWQTPAADVIQAGVVCNGDKATARHLAAIAGTTTLPPIRHRKPKPKPPTHCLGCGQRMVTRPKGKPLPKDLVTHAAHGYCRVCDATRRRQSGWTNPTPTQNQLLS